MAELEKGKKCTMSQMTKLDSNVRVLLQRHEEGKIEKEPSNDKLLASAVTKSLSKKSAKHEVVKYRKKLRLKSREVSQQNNNFKVVQNLHQKTDNISSEDSSAKKNSVNEKDDQIKSSDIVLSTCQDKKANNAMDNDVNSLANLCKYSSKPAIVSKSKYSKHTDITNKDKFKLKQKKSKNCSSLISIEKNILSKTNKGTTDSSLSNSTELPSSSFNKSKKVKTNCLHDSTDKLSKHKKNAVNKNKLKIVENNILDDQQLKECPNSIELNYSQQQKSGIRSSLNAENSLLEKPLNPELISKGKEKIWIQKQKKIKSNTFLQNIDVEKHPSSIIVEKGECLTVNDLDDSEKCLNSNLVSNEETDQHSAKNVDILQPKKSKSKGIPKVTEVDGKQLSGSENTIPVKAVATNCSPSVNICKKECQVSLERLPREKQYYISFHDDNPVNSPNICKDSDSCKTINDNLQPLTDISAFDKEKVDDSNMEKLRDSNGNMLAIDAFMSSLVPSTVIDQNLKNLYEVKSYIDSSNDNLKHETFQFAIEKLLSELSVDFSKNEPQVLNKDESIDNCIKEVENISTDSQVNSCTIVKSNVMNSPNPIETSTKDTSPILNKISCFDSCLTDELQISDKGALIDSNDKFEISLKAQTNVTSMELDENVEFVTGKRRTTIKPVGQGELSDKCCGHWFPNYKAYQNHLMTSSTEELNKYHETLLKELEMVKCTECSKWLKDTALPKHLRKIHKITNVTYGQPLSKVKSKVVETIPIIQSVCSLKQDSDSNSSPCPLSKKKDLNLNPPNILCHLSANKSITVSSVSDLPFSMKPIVMLMKSLSPYKRKFGFKAVPRIVKVESLSSNRCNVDCVNDSLMNNSISTKSKLSDDLLLQEETSPVQKVRKIFSEVNANSTHASKSKVKSKKKSKFCYAQSIQSKCSPLPEETRRDTSIVKGKFCVNKTAKNKKMNGNISKKFQLSDGYFLQDSSNDVSDISSSEESTDEEDNEKDDSVPTVELDLFTLPSVHEDSSVFLTDPSNPDFKVFASMDAIFVGDADQAQPSSQIGYVTDTNNVVYINPEHFLFPNMEDSNINLDTLNLSQEDFEILNKYESKLLDSPSKVSPLKKNSAYKINFNKSPLNKNVSINPAEIPSKLKLSKKAIKCLQRSSVKKSISPIKLSALRDKGKLLKESVSNESNVHIKKQDSTLAATIKIDPIKKALGLVSKRKMQGNTCDPVIEQSDCNRRVAKELDETTEIGHKKSKIRIENCSDLENYDENEHTSDEFFIDNDNISIIETPINKDINESMCSFSNIVIDNGEMGTVENARFDNLCSPVKHIIKVGKENPTINIASKSERKFIIIVHNNVTKSLLKQYPNYGESTVTKRKNSALKGNFNYKTTFDTYKNQYTKFNNYNKNSIPQPKFKRANSDLPTIRQYQSNKQYKISKTPAVIPNMDLAAGIESGSLLDTINIDPNSEIIDLPVDLLENKCTGDSKVAELDIIPSNIITSAEILKANPKNLPLEEMSSKVGELVYLDENGILRSPSGRDINKEVVELDEEALLINMIENYAENLDISTFDSTSLPSPKNNDFPVIPQEDPVQKEKYFDIIKGKGAWDTQLLFSPARNIKRTSSTDTASSGSPYRKKLSRKPSDADLYNIPLSDIPDLLSPARSMSQIGQSAYFINSPVSLSPNTLNAVLSPRGDRTPKLYSRPSPQRTPDLGKRKKSPVSLKKYSNEKSTKESYLLNNGKPHKKLFKPKECIKTAKIINKTLEKLYKTPKKVGNKIPKKMRKKQLPKLHKLHKHNKTSTKKERNKTDLISERQSSEPIAKKRGRPRKNVLKKYISKNHYTDEEADFSGFEDCNDYATVLKPKFSPNSNKKVKLKISLKNPLEPVVIPQIPTTSNETQSSSFSRKSIKRKRPHSDHSECPPSFESKMETYMEVEPLQAIILKNFNNSPTKTYPHITKSKDSIQTPNSPKKKCEAGLKVKPLHKMLKNPISENVNSSLSEDKCINKSLKNVNKEAANIKNSSPNIFQSKIRKKFKRYAEKISQDIRSFFPVMKSPDSSVGGNSFEGFRVEPSTKKQKLIPLSKPRLHSPVDNQRTASDIRIYLATTQVNLHSSEDRAKYLEKRYKHITELEVKDDLTNVPKNFDGFSSNYPEGVAVLRNLQTYVDVLNMQNMFSNNDYSLPLDVTCEWDEETINYELDLC